MKRFMNRTVSVLVLLMSIGVWLTMPLAANAAACPTGFTCTTTPTGGCPTGFTCTTGSQGGCPTGFTCTTQGTSNNGSSVGGSQSSAQALCEGSGGTYSGTTCSGGTDKTVGGILKAVANILIFLVGAVSVVMIIIGGLKYVLSNGDQSQVTSAKNTVLYAIVGIVVAFFAYAIVNFVLTNI